MRVSDAVLAHPPGIRAEHRDERSRTREGELPDDHECEALAAAVPNSGADERAAQPGLVTLRAFGGRESAIHTLHVNVGRRHRLDLQPSTAAFLLNLPHSGCAAHSGMRYPRRCGVSI